jgi:predicted Zn-dependent peptidase
MIYNIANTNDLSSFYIIYDGVVINETNGIYGISHFIEHLICKNLDDNFIDKLEKNGISWNAFTTTNNIIFHIKGLDEYVYKFKNDFLLKVNNFKIDTDVFEIEKKVILEEYSDLFNKYSKNHILNLHRKILNNFNSVGKKEDIQNITIEDCLNYYSKYYDKPSKIIYFSKKYKHESDITHSTNVDKKIISFNTYDNILETPIYSNNKSSIVFISPIIETDFHKIIFITLLLSGGLKSPLYKAIREKNSLAYYINCRIERIDKIGFVTISTETTDSNVNKTIDVIKDVFKDKSYLTQEKFETIKNYIKITILKSNINLQDNEDRYILPYEWLLENYIDIITFDDIILAFDNYFNINKYRISVNKTEFI